MAAAPAAAGAVAVAGTIAASGHPTGPMPVIKAGTAAFVTPSSPPAHQALVTETHKKATLTASPAYTVRKGDYLSRIASEHCPTPADWTGLYLANEKTIGPDPDVIEPGEQLTLDCYIGTVRPHETPWEHWHHLNHVNHMANLSERHAATYSDPGQASVGETESTPVSHSDDSEAPVSHSEAPVSHSEAPVSHSEAPAYHGSGSMQQCIISRESGGNPDVMNASGHYGLYQFSASTWAGSGGNPADFGHASVAEQNQVFANAVAARGYSDWAPYDGC